MSLKQQAEAVSMKQEPEKESQCREEFEKAPKTIEKQGVKIKEVDKELQNALDIIGKQTYIISVLRNGLERLRHDNDWHGVGEVNSFIDKLLAVK